MQELVGRLSALDPEATESLKVVAYFDALVDGHATAEVLLRGAAVLSGCACGFESNGVGMRVDNRGVRSAARSVADVADVAGIAGPADAADVAGFPHRELVNSGRVWLERTGPPHANDTMVVERLTIALTLMLERSPAHSHTRAAIVTVLDAAATVDQRREAAARLRLDPLGQYRVTALPSDRVTAGGHQLVLDTEAGVIRAVIRRSSGDIAEPRAGVGVTSLSTALDESWRTARLALRLTSPREPVLFADELGALLWLATAADSAPGAHPDVEGLRRAITESEPLLATVQSLVATESVRSTAIELAVHHSTLQTRVAALTRVLGYDVRSPAGRTRLSLALHLYLLATNRF